MILGKKAQTGYGSKLKCYCLYYSTLSMWIIDECWICKAHAAAIFIFLEAFAKNVVKRKKKNSLPNV